MNKKSENIVKEIENTRNFIRILKESDIIHINVVGIEMPQNKDSLVSNVLDGQLLINKDYDIRNHWTFRTIVEHLEYSLYELNQQKRKLEKE